MTTATDLVLIYAISFMDLFAVGLTFPLLSNHLRELGASHFSVGLISSLYSGVQVISGPIVGSWSDLRDRKSVLMITLLICSIIYITIGLTTSIFCIAIIRCALGFTKHTQSLCKAVITDLLPIKDRAGAFGKSAAFGSIGFIIGPILGGHLSEINNGFSYVCAVTGLLFVINIGLTSLITYQKNYTTSYSSPNEPILLKIRQEFFKAVTDIRHINWVALWDTFLLRFIFGFSITMYFSQQSIYLREHFNLSQRHIGYIISYFSLIGTVSAFLVHTINKKFYENDTTCFKRLTHFFALMTICLICLSIVPDIQLFLILLIPLSMSCTLLRIISMELMLKQAANDHRGSLAGTSNSIMSVARFITPVSSGFITDQLGVSAALFLAALPPLIGTIVSFRIKVKHD